MTGRAPSTNRRGPGGGQVHVWFSTGAAAGRATLSPGERRRLEGLCFDADRQNYLAARQLLRQTLSRYAPARPADWRFAPDRHGKPGIVAPVPVPALCFSLTRTDGLAACAVSSDAAVGLDAEIVNHPAFERRIASYWLSGDELAQHAARPSQEGRRVLADLWTGREALAKACGHGLALSLGRDSGAATVARIDFRPPPGDWHLEHLRPTLRHSLSVAVAATDGRPATRVRLFDAARRASATWGASPG